MITKEAECFSKLGKSEDYKDTYISDIWLQTSVEMNT